MSEQAAIAPPPPTFHNNPFSNSDFDRTFDAAIAADRATEANEKNINTSDPDKGLVAVAEGTGETEAADPKALASNPGESEKIQTDKKAVIPEVKVDIASRKETPSARAFAEQRKRIAELEAQVAKPAAPSVDVSEYQKKIEAAQKENEELSSRLMIVGIERHEKFKLEVTAPLEQTISTAKSVVPEDMADRVETALRMPLGKSRDKIMEELNELLTPRQQGILNLTDMETQKIMRRRDELLAKPKELWSKMESDSKASMERQSSEMRKVFDIAMEKAISPEDGLFVFQEREGDSTWNTAAKQRRDLASAIYDGSLPHEQRARAALWSAAAPELAGQLEATAKELADVKEENKKLKTATPKVDTGGGEIFPDNDGFAANGVPRDYAESVAERAGKVFDR